MEEGAPADGQDPPRNGLPLAPARQGAHLAHQEEGSCWPCWGPGTVCRGGAARLHPSFIMPRPGTWPLPCETIVATSVGIPLGMFGVGGYAGQQALAGRGGFLESSYLRTIASCQWLKMSVGKLGWLRFGQS